MSEYTAFRTEHGDLVVVEVSPTGHHASVVRKDDVEQFFGKVQGALPAELRNAIRPIAPPRQA